MVEEGLGRVKVSVVRRERIAIRREALLGGCVKTQHYFLHRFIMRLTAQGVACCALRSLQRVLFLFKVTGKNKHH